MIWYLEKIKTNAIMNLTIISQISIFSKYITKRIVDSDCFLDNLCKTLLENKLSTKFRQHLQLLVISIFYAIRKTTEMNKFLNLCIIENLQNFNLNYQTNASLIIITAYILRICINEADFQEFSDIIEILLEKILIYNSHHFHAVKITTQTLVVSIWENQQTKEKITKIVKNKGLLCLMQMIFYFVMNNKELLSIYSSHKFLKNFDVSEEISVNNLMLQLEESSNYCNIFVKYKKSKRFCMSLYENIKKIEQ